MATGGDINIDALNAAMHGTVAPVNHATFKLLVDTSELDDLVRRWHEASAEGLADRGLSQTDREIARLADYLMTHCAGEITEGSAVDVAIRLLDRLRAPFLTAGKWNEDKQRHQVFVDPEYEIRWLRSECTRYARLLNEVSTEDHGGDDDALTRNDDSIIADLIRENRALVDAIAELQAGCQCHNDAAS